LDPLTPGTPGVVTETPGTPGMATLVPAGFSALGTVVAVPGIADAVPGAAGIFDVTSFPPGTKVVAPGAPGTELAAPAAPGIALAAPPGVAGLIEDFAPSSRIFSPSFNALCAKASEDVIAKASAVIVHTIVDRIGGSHLNSEQEISLRLKRH
jgi:hypothetical protein